MLIISLISELFIVQTFLNRCWTYFLVFTVKNSAFWDTQTRVFLSVLRSVEFIFKVRIKVPKTSWAVSVRNRYKTISLNFFQLTLNFKKRCILSDNINNQVKLLHINAFRQICQRYLITDMHVGFIAHLFQGVIGVWSWY